MGFVLGPAPLNVRISEIYCPEVPDKFWLPLPECLMRDPVLKPTGCLSSSGRQGVCLLHSDWPDVTWVQRSCLMLPEALLSHSYLNFSGSLFCELKPWKVSGVPSFLQENEQGMGAVRLLQRCDAEDCWGLQNAVPLFQSLCFLWSCTDAGAGLEVCRSLLFLLKSWKQGSLILELISLENQCEFAPPKCALRQREFPCTCGNSTS